ncbi:MAG: YqgE/AlgH family protein [Candidatus Nanopelagicales bacterium]
MTLEPLDVPPAVPLAGRLLVAAPAMTDPNFARTVVLLLDHDEEGTLGVVLNRPSHVPVGAVLPSWDGRTTGADVVFGGGPVAEDSALGLALLPGPVDGPEPEGFRRVAGPYGLVDLDIDPDGAAAELLAVRIFAGYAGWGEGQLLDEIARGDWYVVDGGSDDVFAADTADLWHRVLRRQPGDLAFLATPSVDPSLN